MDGDGRMPDMSFFSTRQDMETALDEAESAQHVMYVASRSGDGHPSVYRSHREISDWEYQFRIFYVVPVDTRFTCKRDENNDAGREKSDSCKRGSHCYRPDPGYYP